MLKRTGFSMLMLIMLMTLLKVVNLTYAWSEPIRITFGQHVTFVSISGDGSRIVFESNVDGDYEIFVANSDGTGLLQLTNNNIEDGSPSISYDGTRIAFISRVDGKDAEICVINSDGTGFRQLTSNTWDDLDPFLCGDGSKIAFESYIDGDSELCIINYDGTELKRLTNNNVHDVDPTMSYDGTKIAFTDSTNDKIYVINSDGTGLKKLTSNNGHERDPYITSDGKYIIFISDYDLDYQTRSNDEVFIVKTDGSGLAQLTRTSVNNRYTCVSNDNTLIAFYGSQNQIRTIFTMRIDGSDLTPVVSWDKIYYPDKMDRFINGDGSKITFIAETVDATDGHVWIHYEAYVCIPEFSSFYIFSMLLPSTLLIVMVKKNKRSTEFHAHVLEMLNLTVILPYNSCGK